MLFILFAIGIQIVLNGLFPYGGEVSGFVYLVGMPAIILLSILFLFIFNSSTKNVRARNIAMISTLVFSSLVSLIFLFGREEPLYQISQGFHYLGNQDEIEYKELFTHNYTANSINVVAALAKYKNCLPEIGYRITYCCDNFEDFYFEKRDGKYNSDRGEIHLAENHRLIFKDTFDDKIIEFEISVLELEKQRSHNLKLKEQDISINIYRSEFKPNPGFGKVYYNLFNKILENKNCDF